MKLNTNTLSQEQKEMIKNGYEFIINPKGKLEIKKTPELLKQECNKSILAKYPYYKQINMGAEIQEIHLVARLEKREFTDTEMLKVGEAIEMKKWIDEEKDKCQSKISELF